MREGPQGLSLCLRRICRPCNEKYERNAMINFSDPGYLILVEKRNQLDKRFAETCDRAYGMKSIPGYTSPLLFIAAVRAEYEEMRAELTERIEKRIEELKVTT